MSFVFWLRTLILFQRSSWVPLRSSRSKKNQKNQGSNSSSLKPSQKVSSVGELQTSCLFFVWVCELVVSLLGSRWSLCYKRLVYFFVWVCGLIATIFGYERTSSFRGVRELVALLLGSRWSLCYKRLVYFFVWVCGLIATIFGYERTSSFRGVRELVALLLGSQFAKAKAFILKLRNWGRKTY